MTPAERHMLAADLAEWIEGREDYAAWELAESLIKSGWVVTPPKNEGETSE